MTNEAIVRDLLENDGACRDINFSEHISTEGACALLDVIEARWQLIRATDHDGDVVRPGSLRAMLKRESGALSTIWEGPAVPRHLQAFFYWTCSDQVFCELTFFPEDLDPPQFVFEDFLHLLALFVRAARSREYYVRVGDGSWSHAKGSTGSVIFSHETISAVAHNTVNFS
mgnify:CR=1 FL=1